MHSLGLFGCISFASRLPLLVASLDNHNPSTCTACSGLLWFSSHWPVKHGVPLSAPVALVVALCASDSWDTGTVGERVFWPRPIALQHSLAVRSSSSPGRDKKLSDCWSVRAPETPAGWRQTLDAMLRCNGLLLKHLFVRPPLIRCSKSVLR